MSQSPRAGDGGTAAAFRPGRAAAASWHAGTGEQGRERRPAPAFQGRVAGRAQGARPEAGGAGAEPCHRTAPEASSRPGARPARMRSVSVTLKKGPERQDQQQLQDPPKKKKII